MRHNLLEALFAALHTLDSLDQDRSAVSNIGECTTLHCFRVVSNDAVSIQTFKEAQCCACFGADA